MGGNPHEHSDISRRAGARVALTGDIHALRNEIGREGADLGGLVDGGGELREKVEAEERIWGLLPGR